MASRPRKCDLTEKRGTYRLHGMAPRETVEGREQGVLHGGTFLNGQMWGAVGCVRKRGLKGFLLLRRRSLVPQALRHLCKGQRQL